MFLCFFLNSNVFGPIDVRVIWFFLSVVRTARMESAHTCRVSWSHRLRAAAAGCRCQQGYQGQGTFIASIVVYIYLHWLSVSCLVQLDKELCSSRNFVSHCFKIVSIVRFSTPRMAKTHWIGLGRRVDSISSACLVGCVLHEFHFFCPSTHSFCPPLSCLVYCWYCDLHSKLACRCLHSQN